MTKFNTILICALLISIASARVTNLETIKAWNFFRQNPTVVASMIEKTYVLAGVDGVHKDALCYKNAITALKNQAPAAPLTESVGVTLSATQFSRFIIQSNKGQLTHTGDATNVTLKDRLLKFGKFISNYNIQELATSFNQDSLVSANEILLQFVTDCNNESKSNFKAVYADVKDYTHAGIGISVVGSQTVAVLILSKSFSSNPVSNAVLTAAGIEGNADYSGKGESMPSTSAKTNDAFAHTGKEIYPGLNPANVAANDAFPNTNDDGSVRCPSWVHPANAKAGGYMRDWALTQAKCVRGTEDFKKTNNLRRIAPFAHKGKCYHRLSYCSDQGLVWVKDREYNTLEAIDAGAAQAPKTPILSTFVNDKSTDCPPFVNGPLLRKRFVQDWYLNGKSCAIGTEGFNKNGFKNNKAIAMDKKCYHRSEFCDNKGRVWFRDSEYKTLAEFRAEQH
jgi:hypothetical protein